MKKPTIAEEIDMKTDWRDLYKKIGPEGCYQVLYEILLSAEWLIEVIKEEKDKVKN